MLDRGLETALAGDDPHLDEAHRLCLAVIAFRMLHARAEGCSLDRARWQDPAVAEAVGVFEAALGDVGDPLDVAVGMHRPDGTRHQAVVVEDAQVPEPCVLRIDVIVEAEMPVRTEPATLGVVQ